ncbi:MAG: Rrf2 family transcriptional regulator, partial [Thermus sp.]
VGQCSTELLWKRVDLAMRQVLGGTTLKDLIEERKLIEAKRLIQLQPTG